MIRQPIITLMGHVDHGKSSILDIINKTAIVKSEAGGITQKISSTIVPSKTIKKICGSLLTTKLTIPGLLFIDTPGHAAFNNLRKRGGNLADIAILVIDINEGLMPQTKESLEILKTYKTPFVIALNKTDLIHGWKNNPNKNLIQNINSQAPNVQEELEKKLYEIVGQLYEKEFESERFDRVKDFTKQIALVPCSAITGEGIPELLMIISGLAQKYMEKELDIKINSPGKGTILEVKKEKGLGNTIDIILYEGKIKKNDQIIVGTLNKPIVTKVKALLEPGFKKLEYIDEAEAAAGIKISAPEIEDAVSGMPIKVVSNLKEDKKEIRKEIEEVLLETDKEGILVKADSLGSLEALINLLRKEKIKIKKGSIGDITKKDISEASAETNPLYKTIVGFNVKKEKDSKEVKIITKDIIYSILDELKEWQDYQQKLLEAKELEDLPKLTSLKILPGCIFRQNNPAVVGVEILSGKLKTNTPIFKDDKELTKVKSIQSENENVSEVEKGKQVAISLPGVTAGRQVKINDILYTYLNETEFRKYKELKRFLNKEEMEILKKIAEINRKNNNLWGI